MALPASFLDELRTRLPLSAAIGRTVKLSRAGREWKGCCPFHNEKTASFYVNDEKSFYHCFGCGAHGDVIGFTMKQQGLEFPDAIEHLAREAGLQVPVQRREAPEVVDAREKLYKLCDAACAFFSAQLYAPAGRQALAYLQQRGLTEETIAAWRLGYAPEDAQALKNHLLPQGYTERELEQVGLWRQRDDRSGGYSFFRGRAMFPVMDRRGRPIAFGARLLAGDGPKYINSPEHQLFKKGELLFGTDKARLIPASQPLLLVEGYMDVISLWQAGFAAVAPLGTALTEGQTAVLWQAARPRDNQTPILCFDGDNAGVRAATRAVTVALPHLAPDRSLSFCFLPTGEDPDSLVKNRGAAAFTQVLTSAQPLIDVLWRRETAGQSFNTPEDRAQLEKNLAAATGVIQDASVRSHYEREIKNRLWPLFNPRQNFKTQQNGGKFVKTGASANGMAGANRLPPVSPILSRERAALALLINYPALFASAENWLLHHVPLNASFAPILNALVKAPEILGSGLDADELHRYLLKECGGAALSDLLSETTYQHAGFARPGRSLASAEAGWRDLEAQLTVARLKEDLAIAQREYREQLTPETQERFLALQTELSSLPDILADMPDGH